MEFRHLVLEIESQIARVTLNRPEVRNAFNDRLIHELHECFKSLGEREDLRAVILSGAGKVFCAGADINWMRSSIQYTREENFDDAMRMAEMLQAIDRCPVPVIARVHRAAFGGALGLIGASDIAVASRDTKFSFSEVRLGILPAVISTFVLRKIGYGQARRYFLTGEVFDAEQAKAMGLVHEVVDEDELDTTVENLIEAIRKAGPKAVREAKKLLHTLPHIDPGERVRFCAETIARVRVTDEAQAGLKAFLDRESPPWLNPNETSQ